jgi:hypothetical protein
MKAKSISQSAFFDLPVLIGLFVLLAGVFLALLGYGTFSSVSAQTNENAFEQMPVGNNNIYIGGACGPTLPAGWRLAGVADFNGNGENGLCAL